MNTLLTLLSTVSAVLAYCESTYSAPDWHGWETTDNICFGFVIDSHYSCSAYPQLSLPTIDSNATYLHLGNYPIGPEGRCAGFLGETGPCLSSQDTSLGRSSTRQVFAESPVLNFSAATDCTIQLELMQGQDRDFFTGNAQNYYKYFIYGVDDDLPERAATWTSFSSAYDGRSRVRIHYGNAYSSYSPDATLLAIRSLSVQCRGNVTGPNVSTECFPDPTPSASPVAVSVSALQEATGSLAQSGSAEPEESVSSIGSAIDCTWPIFFCCVIWIMMALQYADVDSKLISGVWLTLLVLFFSKLYKWVQRPFN